MTNDLNHNLDDAKRMKRKRGCGQNASTANTVQGEWVCQAAFVAIVQMSRATINKIVTSVAADGFSLTKARFGTSRHGRPSIISWICVQFLQPFGAMNYIACPTSRGSTNDEHVRYLDSKVSKENIYEAYSNCWKAMLKYVLECNYWLQNIPNEPLKYR